MLLTHNMYKSQILDITPNAQNINHNIDKFVGTWIWANGNERLVLIFKKENILLPLERNVRADILYGFHQYAKNNTVLESSTQYLNTTYTAKKSTLLGGSFDDHNKISGSIQHKTKNKSVKFEIDYVDANHIKLIRLENFQGISITLPGQQPYDSSISLPQNIILIKQ